MEAFKITGIDRSGKRFKIESSNSFSIACIKVYRGSLWSNRNGKWKLEKRYF